MLVAMAWVLGALLRCLHSDSLAVEHFDEGVYSSATWYDSVAGEPWPMRFLYAPPLLPKSIQVLDSVPGLKNVAPFLPAMVLGSLTVLAMWWLARILFGQSAGLFGAFIVSLSDFHIQFSRMALTDAPALFWIILSVTVAVKGISSGSIRSMMLAGFLCGIAWWTKYTGWLPLAIVISGTAGWWLHSGRRTQPLLPLIKLLTVMVLVAIVTWAPWLWMLQDVGGYSAVAANHKGYFVGLNGWQNRLAHHLFYHFRLDSWLGAAALGLGLLVAGTRRWIEERRSTWNSARLNSGTAAASAGEASDQQAVGDRDFPTPRVLAKFVGAAIVMTVLANGVGGTVLLTCIGIAGLLGMFLTPSAATTATCSTTIAGNTDQLPATTSRLATVDPRLSAFIALAWFAGMLLTTPMYQAYPRLSLTLLASIWLAAAGGIAWWFEATIISDRSASTTPPSARSRFLKSAVKGLVGAAVVLALFQSSEPSQPFVWQSRTSLQDASWQLADIVLKHSVGDFSVTAAPPVTDDNGLITPEPEWDQRDADGKLLPEPTEFERLLEKVAPAADTSTPLTTASVATCVVYGFGEPSVIRHLNAAGLVVTPVQDVKFGPASLAGKPLPTYLVIGPNALRTPGFLYDWCDQQSRFEHITDVWFYSSDIVLFNLFPPSWIAQHPECQVQKLELYICREGRDAPAGDGGRDASAGGGVGATGYVEEPASRRVRK